VEHHINPTGQDLGRFAAIKWDGPLHMLNLIRLRENAVYEDGRKASGAEAYAIYSKAVMPHLARHGARLVWSARPAPPLIGPAHEIWDIAFVVEYPSHEAFVSMLSDPAYRDVSQHRTAAVEDSRLVPMHPQEMGGKGGLPA